MSKKSQTYSIGVMYKCEYREDSGRSFYKNIGSITTSETGDDLTQYVDEYVEDVKAKFERRTGYPVVISDVRIMKNARAAPKSFKGAKMYGVHDAIYSIDHLEKVLSDDFDTKNMMCV